MPFVQDVDGLVHEGNDGEHRRGILFSPCGRAWSGVSMNLVAGPATCFGCMIAALPTPDPLAAAVGIPPEYLYGWDGVSKPGIT